MNYLIKSIFIEDNNKEYNILIGRNAIGNDTIIKIANQNDIWFHFCNISGPHIILQNTGDIIPKKYINQIASMLFDYKSNAPKNSSVMTTEIKNVKLTNTPGTVNVTNTKIIKF
jgi:predicted ribosome quality control (RQC) complex YloA/Tae2 family protein